MRWPILATLVCFGADAACAAGRPAPSPSSPPVVASALSPPPFSEADAAVPIVPGHPTWGSRSAPATLVLIGDFEQPSQMVAPIIAQAEARFGPDALRVVWMGVVWPTDARTRESVEAAQGVFALAGADALWKFYAAASAVKEQPLPTASLVGLAAQAGVKDTRAFQDALASHAWSAAVDANMREVHDADVVYRPAILVNGALVDGFGQGDRLLSAIDTAIAEGRAAVAAGTPPDQVYAVLARKHRDEALRVKAINDAKVAAGGRVDQFRQQAEAARVYDVPIGHSPTRGLPLARATMVVFFNELSPGARALNAAIDEQRTKLGDNFRLVWKAYPDWTNPASEAAAEALLEVRAEKGDDAFWKARDALVAPPKPWIDETTPEAVAANVDVIVGVAAGAGASADAVRRAIAQHAHREAIEADEDLHDDLASPENGSLASQATVFVNGHRLLRAPSRDELASAVQARLVDAVGALPATGETPDPYAAYVRDGVPRAGLPIRPMPRSLPPGDPTRGKPDAPVTIHEWCGFYPSCQIADQFLALAVKRYGDRVRVVWHDLPLYAPLPSHAAREAFAQRGDSSFWAMHDKLFVDRTAYTRQKLEHYAEALKLDMGLFAKALDEKIHAAEIDADVKAAEEANLGFAPIFLVTARGAPTGALIGLEPPSRLRRAIDRALTEAKAPATAPAPHATPVQIATPIAIDAGAAPATTATPYVEAGLPDAESTVSTDAGNVSAGAPFIRRESELAGSPGDPTIAHEWRAPALRTSEGPCWKRYATLTADEQASAFAAFQARNPGWFLVDGSGLDRFTGLVRWAMPTADERATGPTDLPALLQRARALVRKNSDLLGLDDHVLSKLVWNARPALPGSPLSIVSAELDDLSATTGAPFPELEPRVSISVMIGVDGAIGWLQTRVSPRESICVKPRLTPDQARRLPGVVGRKLGFFGNHGPVDAGVVQPKDVREVKLGVQWQDNDRFREYRLVYRITVGTNLSWTIVVDAMDGHVLGVIQNFQT